MTLDAATEGDLVAGLGANGTRKHDLGEIGLDGGDTRSRGSGANVEHENLLDGEFLDAAGLAVGLDTEQMAQEEKVDLKLDENVWETVGGAENVSDHLVGATQSGIHLCSDSDESSGDGVFQIICLCKQRHDDGGDGRALDASLILFNDSGANFDGISNLWID